MSLPGRPEGQPTWNHPYLFCDERDKATLFTPGAALVLEYYIATAGNIISPCYNYSARSVFMQILIKESHQFKFLALAFIKSKKNFK